MNVRVVKVVGRRARGFLNSENFTSSNFHIDLSLRRPSLRLFELFKQRIIRVPGTSILILPAAYKTGVMFQSFHHTTSRRLFSHGS